MATWRIESNCRLLCLFICRLWSKERSQLLSDRFLLRAHPLLCWALLNPIRFKVTSFFGQYPISNEKRLLWTSRKGMKTQKSPLIPSLRNEGRVEGDECRKLFHHFTTIHDVNTMVGGRGLATRKVVSLRRCGSIRCVSLNARRIHHFD